MRKEKWQKFKSDLAYYSLIVLFYGCLTPFFWWTNGGFSKCSDKRNTIKYYIYNTEEVCSKIDTAFAVWDWDKGCCISYFGDLPDSTKRVYLNRVYDNIVQYDSIFLKDDKCTVLVSGDRFSHIYLYEWSRFSVRKNGKELSIDIDENLDIRYDFDFGYDLSDAYWFEILK